MFRFDIHFMFRFHIIRLDQKLFVADVVYFGPFNVSSRSASLSGNLQKLLIVGQTFLFVMLT